MHRDTRRLNTGKDWPQTASSSRLQRLVPVQYVLHKFSVVRFRSFGYRCRQPSFLTAPLQILKGHF
jgi:hypothetical protein